MNWLGVLEKEPLSNILLHKKSFATFGPIAGWEVSDSSSGSWLVSRLLAKL